MKKKRKEPDYLFSKDLRDKLSTLGDMDVAQALCDERFWRALCEHAGLDFDKISEEAKEKGPSRPLTPDDFGPLMETLKNSLGKEP